MAAKELILFVPLDPVHDVGIRLIEQGLREQGYLTKLLPPDLPIEDIVRVAAEEDYAFIMVGRTISYQTAELMARLVDMLDRAGVRQKAKLVAGGKAMTPELAAELGFDKGFDANTKVEHVVAFVQGRPITADDDQVRRVKKDVTAPYSYQWRNSEAEQLCFAVADQVLDWASRHTSPGVARAQLRKLILTCESDSERNLLRLEYASLCDPSIASAYREGIPVEGTRWIEPHEVDLLEQIPATRRLNPIRTSDAQPLVIFFTGSGCPIMDIQHNRIAAECGADGTIVICPSWAARREGMLSELVTHQHDGTVPSVENVLLMKNYLREDLYFQLRAHRGLNTAETSVIAVHAGVDFCKVNPIYGSLGGGTDPERLVLDAVYAIRTVAEAGTPYDMPANDELCGIPFAKNLAGMLVTAAIGLRVGGRPIMKPLFCYSPNVMVGGQMKDNYVDYNAAKIAALRGIIDAPIWPGEPVGFYTHEDDRCQSATTTALHAALAASLGVDLMTFASTDESYSRGPITIASRVDTFNALRAMFRFFGSTKITPT
ncbi:MAG TPA: cobalamin-dependent protein, partial [bacterium]|nr:cobalamin-dependent protein [bacterium]